MTAGLSSDGRQHLNGGAALVDALERQGVDTVFGIPGVHNLEIYRRLATSSIRHVAVRHEQGGGYAADGYARASGRPGICLTTSGPGATNACTAAANAYADSVPVLFCAPGPPVGTEGLDLGLLHEMKDHSSHFESLVTVSARPKSPEEIGAVVDEVFDGWRRARPRPVHLELPIDVIEGKWREGDRAQDRREAARVRAAFDAIGPARATTPGTTPAPDAALDRAAQLLSASRLPLVVLGGGARDTAGGAQALAERLGALVLTTVNGKGAVPETHALSLGASIRLPETRRLFESADAVLVVGSELGDSDLWGVPVRTNTPVVRIDVDPHQLQKNLPAAVAICMDASAAVHALLARLGPAPALGAGGATWADSAEAVRETLRKEALVEGAQYEVLNRALCAALPEATIVAGDSAQVSYFGTAHFWPMGRAGQFLYPTGYATLGYGLPAAIGAKLACPADPVVVLVGDGGFLFTVQELLTAVEQRLALPVVIVDNHGYAEIRQGMEARGIEPIAVDRPAVDFAALSQSLGGRGVAVDSVEALCTHVVDALSADGPTVISIDVTAGGAG